jgi:hypothetical protein
MNLRCVAARAFLHLCHFVCDNSNEKRQLADPLECDDDDDFFDNALNAFINTHTERFMGHANILSSRA